MASPTDSPSPAFPPTRWTLLQQLRLGSETESKHAMDTLCRAYWYPLYAVARRRGLPDHDAQDATQGFFLQLLKRDSLHGADQSRGKLRSMLLTAFDNHLRELWRHASRIKRGGHVEHVAWLDLTDAEQRYSHTQDLGISDIETLYTREWARSVLENAIAQLRLENAGRGSPERFDALVLYLTQPDEAAPHREAAEALGITGEAFRVALHRLRQQYRACIEAELSRTLDTDDPTVIRQELADLFKAFTQ